MKHVRTPNARRRLRALSILAFCLTVFSAVWFLGGCMKKPQSMTPLPGRGELHGGSYAPYSIADPDGSFDMGPAAAGRKSFSARLPNVVRRRSGEEAVPGALPSLDEELWIISRPSQRQAADRDDFPGSGTLMTRWEDREVPVPLKHTDVRASIDGFIATVKVVQQFHNPFATKIEAVYLFPLPDNAAVNEFIMTLGERRIRGVIRERQEAEKLYDEAKRQGYVASLLTQERPNVFTQSVANIEPGREIDVTIKYFHTLTYADGWFEFIFPMVVGPRFNPPGSTSGVGAVGRGHQGLSGQKTEVTYLRPHERNGHDIAVAVEINTDAGVEEVACTSHDVTQAHRGAACTAVALSPRDSIPNKDFVLRYRVAGERVKSHLLTHRDERGGFFTLMLYPPRGLQALGRNPLELVFVLDCSGSMSGRPLEQAKAAVERALRLLEPGDSFQLINFSISASQLGYRPLEATPANVERARRHLRALQSEGGTMMIEGVKAALDFPHDPQRLRFVCFLTDGYIGNETDILRAVHERLADARIFSFGVGSSPNRFLLDRMAKLGRGAVAYLGHNDDAGQVMDDFFARISHPALTDVKIDWGDLEVSDVFPRRVPDLFVGRPVILAGRFQRDGRKTLRISGRVGRDRVELPLAVNLGGPDETREAFPSVWARLKIADLADQAIYSRNPFLRGQIRQLALDYSLLSAYTAFVAVDSSTRTAGRTGTTVPVPVPVPEGVKYGTTVGE